MSSLLAGAIVLATFYAVIKTITKKWGKSK